MKDELAGSLSASYGRCRWGVSRARAPPHVPLGNNPEGGQRLIDYGDGGYAVESPSTLYSLPPRVLDLAADGWP